MSWRSVLEDAYTVKCKGCGVEFVDPGKWASQKGLRGRCPLCGHAPHKRCCTRRVPGTMHVRQ